MERWNTHFSTLVEQELFGLPLRLFQDPNSNNLGTTVWDASIVLAKYLEKNASKGLFSAERVKTGRCIELGSGVGLGGIAFALLGCQDVTLTDKHELLPLLQRNVHANLSPSALSGTRFEGRIGSVEVCALDWSAELGHVAPPYDYLIAADCVYHENHMPDLLNTILQLTDHKSTILIVNELRSQSVHQEFHNRASRHFTLKKLPTSAMHPLFCHPDIHLYLLKQKRNASYKA